MLFFPVRARRDDLIPTEPKNISEIKRLCVVLRFHIDYSVLVCRYLGFRPFLIPSGPASRKRPFSTGLFSTRFFHQVLLLIASRVDFIVFVLFLEAVGVRGVLPYCCMAVENRLAALFFARSTRATHASRATNLRPSGLVAFGLAESRQSYVRGAALSREPTATAGVAFLVGKMASITRATAIV